MPTLRAWQYNLGPVQAGADGIGEMRVSLKLPDSIPKPAKVWGAMIMNQGYPLPEGSNGGLWFVAADPDSYFSRLSRWPLTEAGTQSNFVAIATMDFKPYLPMMVQQFLPVPYLYREEDCLAVHGAFLVAPGPAGTQPSANMIFELYYEVDDPAVLALDEEADAFTKILINCQGIPNLSTFKDTSSNRTITQSGNARISYSDLSGECAGIFDGVDIGGGVRSGMSVAASGGLAVGSGDWSMELRAKPANVTAGHRQLCSTGSGYAASFYIGQNGTNYIFSASSTGTSWNVASQVVFGTAAAGVPASIGVFRDGSNIRLFCDGVLGATVSVSGALFDSGSPFYIGNNGPTGSQAFVGEIGRIHFAPGIARQTAAYTPTTNPIVYPL